MFMSALILSYFLLNVRSRICNTARRSLMLLRTSLKGMLGECGFNGYFNTSKTFSNEGRHFAIIVKNSNFGSAPLGSIEVSKS
jgi:hypothetical protein